LFRELGHPSQKVGLNGSSFLACVIGMMGSSSSQISIAKRQPSHFVDQRRIRFVVPSPSVELGPFPHRPEPMTAERIHRTPRLTDRPARLPPDARLEIAVLVVVVPGAAGFVAVRGVDADALQLFDEHLGDALFLDIGLVRRDHQAQFLAVLFVIAVAIHAIAFRLRSAVRDRDRSSQSDTSDTAPLPPRGPRNGPTAYRPGRSGATPV
jgi:hypothetical protein